MLIRKNRAGKKCCWTAELSQFMSRSAEHFSLVDVELDVASLLLCSND